MRYLASNFSQVLQLFGEHLYMAGLSLGIALLVALPLGFALVRLRWLQGPVMGLLGVLYTIPSLSLLVLLIPLLGLGTRPAVTALAVYAQFMLVRNWVSGLTGIDPSVLEAADGMGMNIWQRFYRVELPLAQPLLLAGIRLAGVSVIGIAAIAAFINAGGLGKLLFEGVITNHIGKIIAGSLAVSVLALAFNTLMRLLERRAEAWKA